MTQDDVKKQLESFALGTGGIGNWLMNTSDSEIFERLSNIESMPLKKVQLNQLLVMGHEAPVSDGFFEYYWCSIPSDHPYNVKSADYFKDVYDQGLEIKSLEQFKWGMSRIFIDSLLYWGSVRTGFRELRNNSLSELQSLFDEKRVPTEIVNQRGKCLDLENISKDKRYLISEMACKSYGSKDGSKEGLRDLLLEAFSEHRKLSQGSITIKELLSGEKLPKKHSDRQQELEFSADEILDLMVNSESDIEAAFSKIYKDFDGARRAALTNTKRYLSMVSDLDVYVATSMRNRHDFRDMASKTEAIFSDKALSGLELRYFDPTLSAADGHEDKGLIECLMVKCAKVLLYCAGEKESYGKDAEAAMALSLGKPVIFLCDHEQRARFYKEIHPLSRLIQFATGVPVGVMVTDNLTVVAKLLNRIFNNNMEYDLDHNGDGYLRLKERLTESTVRLQTNDRLLNETFWNHYHSV